MCLLFTLQTHLCPVASHGRALRIAHDTPRCAIFGLGGQLAHGGRMRDPIRAQVHAIRNHHFVHVVNSCIGSDTKMLMSALHWRF